MTQVAEKFLGGGSDAVAKQQAEQQAQIEAQQRATAAIEAGQRRVNGGGAGFLSFLDDKLKSTFGG